MAVNPMPQNGSIKLVFPSGSSISPKSISNVKATATDENVYSVAAGIKSLYQVEPVDIIRVENTILINV